MAPQPAYSSEYQRPTGFKTPESPGVRPAEAIVIADAMGNALYASRAASEILLGPDAPGSWAESRVLVDKRLKSLLAPSTSDGPMWPPSSVFISGRRRYVCRWTPLEALAGTQATWLVVLERESNESDALCVAKRRYHLTIREGEVVGLLVAGMVTKEIADHMGISVNTVKAFIRLVMGKMGVTTRSGIVGKVLSNPRDSRELQTPSRVPIDALRRSQG